MLNCHTAGSQKHLISKDTNSETHCVKNIPEMNNNCTVLYFLDASQLILDVNSVHPSLHLSEGNRTATMKSEPRNYPEHPERFDHWQQVRIDCLQRCHS